MPISGPITPTYYGLPYQASPNPTLGNLYASGEEGTIFTCTKTGRMWVIGRTNNAPGAPTYTVRQMLPLVRNDSGTDGVQVTNNNGEMLFSPTTGANVSQTRFISSLVVETSDWRTPGVVHYPVFGNIQSGAGTLRCRVNTDLVMAIFPELAALTADVTISAANTAQVLSSLNFANPSEESWVRFAVQGVVSHNNACDVSVAIVRWRVANSKFEPLAATTVSLPSTGGHAGFSVEVDKAQLFNDENGSDSLRVYVASSHSGVVVKSTPAFTFNDTRSPAVPPPTTYRIAEVLA